MTSVRACVGLLLVLFAAGARAQPQPQPVIEGHEILQADRPEAWAMNHAAIATLFTGFGTIPTLSAGQWQGAVDVAEVPWLDAAQRQVGFNGDKSEDVNKSPVFGRLRAIVGLPSNWVAELAWTPPIRMGGASAQGLFAASVGHLVLDQTPWAVSVRAFGQRGSIHGDITCPSNLAGLSDPLVNPYGCDAASNDSMELDYYGFEVDASRSSAAWRWHVGGVLVRTELEVQVDALTYGYRDRTRLTANATRHGFTLGFRRALGSGWSLAGEVLHVPLPVRRNPLQSVGNDPFTGLRLQLAYARPSGD